MDNPQENTPEISDEIAKPNVKLSHTYNYIGGYYAYKNSSKKSTRLDPESLEETILLTKPGQAQRLMMSYVDEQDDRAGVYPQHNSPEEFRTNLELIPARDLKPYISLTSIKDIEQKGFKNKKATMTKERLRKIKSQFSHLEEFAFNQMMDITRPDKRDFDVWYKSLPNAFQMMIAYPCTKTKEILFLQVIKYDEQGRIHSIKHTTFGDKEPLVINESCVDSFGNLRQIAHMGAKGGSSIYNSVERFDDGTVLWIVTGNKITGAAALRPDDKIELVSKTLNTSAALAIRNVGGEGVARGKWTGKVDKAAMMGNPKPMHEAFKKKVRDQIDQIIDGATIPGLEPIFWVKPE